jgi:hypothetical protein
LPNVDFPHGFQPVGRTQAGGSIEIEYFNKVVGHGTAVFPGDLVAQVADGSIQPGGTPGTTVYTGVALNYGAASTATRHVVAAQPDAIFEAQDDDGTTGIVAADMGANANAIFGAGDTVRRISGHEIDQDTAGTTATLDLKLLRLHKAIENDFGPHARIEVLINRHRRAYGSAGV